MEKLWTITEAAQALAITEADVEQLVRQGRLTGYKLGGQFLRFRPDQVQALKETGSLQPRTVAPPTRARRSWLRQAREFVYFNDFYIVSACLLAVLVVYLIASG